MLPPPPKNYKISSAFSYNFILALTPNYRNGYTKKTVKTQLGEVEIRVPRDRNGSFEPKIIGKYSRNADGMEEKMIGLYASGTSRSRSKNYMMWRSLQIW